MVKSIETAVFVDIILLPGVSRTAMIIGMVVFVAISENSPCSCTDISQLHLTISVRMHMQNVIHYKAIRINIKGEIPNERFKQRIS